MPKGKRRTKAANGRPWKSRIAKLGLEAGFKAKLREDRRAIA
jgi:hypothetical protein